MELKCLKIETLTSANGHKIGRLKISRPEAMNALNKQLMHELRLFFTELETKNEFRVLIVTGDGEKAFVAGADIKEMETMSPSQAREMALSGQQVMQKIEDLRIPVIAAVNGFALGGGLELALACDFMVASEKCKWGLPEVTLGLIPGYGGTQRLTRVLGRALAKRVAMSGEMFTAQQGYEWGLFTQIVEAGALESTCVKLAETLASRAPLALNWVKEAVHQGGDRQLSAGLHLEAELFGRTFETKDRTEGVQAFINKRPAQFQGN